jgi:hypothetical protein
MVKNQVDNTIRQNTYSSMRIQDAVSRRNLDKIGSEISAVRDKIDRISLVRDKVEKIDNADVILAHVNTTIVSALIALSWLAGNLYFINKMYTQDVGVFNIILQSTFQITMITFFNYIQMLQLAKEASGDKINTILDELNLQQKRDMNKNNISFNLQQKLKNGASQQNMTGGTNVNINNVFSALLNLIQYESNEYRNSIIALLPSIFILVLKKQIENKLKSQPRQ